MKKTFKMSIIVAMAMFITMLFASCSMIKMDPEFKKLGIKIMSKHLAYELKQKNPEIVKDGIKICDQILESDGNFEYLFTIAIIYLSKEIENDIIRSDYVELLNMIKVEGGIDIEKARLCVQSFKQGLLL